MSYDTALASFAWKRPDDASDLVRIVCATATAAHLAGHVGRRDRIIEIAADLVSDARLKGCRRPD